MDNVITRVIDLDSTPIFSCVAEIIWPDKKLDTVLELHKQGGISEKGSSSSKGLCHIFSKALGK